MDLVKLTDVCEFQGGSQPPKEQWIKQKVDGYIRMLQIRDFTQGTNDIEYVKVSNSIKTCKKEDILIARYGASIGKILTGLEGAYNVAIIKTILDEEIIKKRYLYFYLKSSGFQNKIGNVGSRAAQAGFNKEDLNDFMLYLPDKSIQNKIIQILDKAQSLINQRKEQIVVCDDLIKSRFVEMFGDPVINPRNWKMVELSEVADIKIGPFGTLLHKEDYIQGGHALVNPSHIVDEKICCDDKLTITDEKYEELSSYHLQKNDVVMGRRGEMGRCAIVENDGLLCGTGSFIIRPKGQLASDFIHKVISFPSYKRTIEDMAVGQTMPNLNVPIVSSFKIPLVPRDVQEQYYSFLEQVDKLKFVLNNSRSELENNFNALMQKAFKGELFSE